MVKTVPKLLVNDSHTSIQRQAIETIQAAVASVPSLGDPRVFLRHDSKVRDAVLTLNAMGVEPGLVCYFVADEIYTENIHLAVLAAATTIEIKAILKAMLQC